MTRPNDSRRRRHRGGRRGRGRQGADTGRSRVANSQANDNVPVPAGLVFYCKTCQTMIDFHPETFNFNLPDGLCPHAAARKELTAAGGAAAELAAANDAAGSQAGANQAGSPTPAGASSQAGAERGRRRPRKDREDNHCEIVYGTERSIKHFFKIPDSNLDARRREAEERAAKADKL